MLYCINLVSYQVLLNGVPTSTFFPSRGLRQSHPLSPYLFILCAEGLYSLLHNVVQRCLISGVKICPRVLALNHLFFADDSLLFCKATRTENEFLRQLLHTYKLALGQ